MNVNDLLEVTNNTLVTITTDSHQGGCILMETPSARAKADLGEYKNGKLLNSKVLRVKVYHNTLEIIIEKE